LLLNKLIVGRKILYSDLALREKLKCCPKKQEDQIAPFPHNVKNFGKNTISCFQAK
jgi:hypothetical protein